MTSSPAGRDDPEMGFTLLELLVVVAVLSLLSGLMLTGFRTVIDSWHRLSQHDTDRREMHATRDLLRALLSQAYPAMIGVEASQRVVAFNGTSNRIDFMAPLAERFGATDIVAYSLYFASDHALHMTWRLSRVDGEDFPRNHPADTIVMEGVGHGQFRYFGSDVPKDVPIWQQAWVGRRKLPELIVVRLAGDQPESDKEPDLVVAPLITGALCSTEADGRCRD